VLREKEAAWFKEKESLLLKHSALEKSMDDLARQLERKQQAVAAAEKRCADALELATVCVA
jgi:peptidoglycan hydrolase CwlO-like protein